MNLNNIDKDELFKKYPAEILENEKYEDLIELRCDLIPGMSVFGEGLSDTTQELYSKICEIVENSRELKEKLLSEGIYKKIASKNT